VNHEASPSKPDRVWEESLRQVVPSEHLEGVKASLSYARDRVGVRREMPLAAARYLRAYFNWAIDTLSLA